MIEIFSLIFYSSANLAFLLLIFFCYFWFNVLIDESNNKLCFSATANVRVQAAAPIAAVTGTVVATAGTATGTPTVIRPVNSTPIAGKQLILQKPLSQGQIVTLVKTSQGMTVASLPKGMVPANKPTTTTVVSQSPVKMTPTIVKLLPNSNKITGMKTVPPGTIQLNKGNKTIVISKTGQQIIRGPGSQVLVVSSGSGIRTVQTVSNQQSTVSNTTTTTLNINPVSSPGTNVKLSKPFTITMPVTGLHQAGKPVTITKQAVSNTGTIINVPAQTLSKQVIIGGKPVTVQIPSNMQPSHQRTVTLVGNQVTTGPLGKLVCLPNSSGLTTVITTEQSGKLVYLPTTQAVTTVAATEQPRLVTVPASAVISTVNAPEQPAKLVSITNSNIVTTVANSAVVATVASDDKMDTTPVEASQLVGTANPAAVEQIKLIRPKQPSATIASASVSAFDSPATTDAALAALAAEAGLIPASADSDTADNESSLSQTSSREDINMDSQDDKSDSLSSKTDSSVSVALTEPTSTTETVAGLFGGGRYTKLSLKGGSKYSSSVTGNRPFMWRKGLLGGGNGSDSETPTTTSSGGEASQSTDNVIFSQTSNQDTFEMKSDFDEYEEEEEENFSLRLTPDAEKPQGEVMSDSNSRGNGKENEEAYERVHGKSESDDPLRIKTEDGHTEKRESEETTNSGTVLNGAEAGEFNIKKKEEVGDALSTLASAALGTAASQSFCKKEDPNSADEEKKEVWYTVGFVKGNSYEVQNYFLAEDEALQDLTVDSLPDFSNRPRINLEPGTAYKFRVAAINSCGRGEWSEVSLSAVF